MPQAARAHDIDADGELGDGGRVIGAPAAAELPAPAHEPLLEPSPAGFRAPAEVASVQVAVVQPPFGRCLAY